MRTVGIRELKARLSEYVRAVRSGDVVLVTERGQVVAELRSPITTRDLPPELRGLGELAERGVVTIGVSSSGDLYPASAVRVAPGTARELLEEDRGDR
jgi:antitoxin (DNA-binding transcriptional repressor) of toxin-antitoxin stability system